MSARRKASAKKAAPAGKARSIRGETVQQCFKEAAEGQPRRLVAPPIDECDFVAEQLSKQALQIGTVIPARNVLGKAEVDAKRLAKRLPKLRDSFGELYAEFHHRGTAPKDNPYRDAFAELDKLDEALQSVLTRYGTKKPFRYTWHDFAIFISLYGERGWRGTIFPNVEPYIEDDSASGVPASSRAPRSLDPGGPLCFFVKAVLAKFGINHTLETVSAALRERRGPRSN